MHSKRTWFFVLSSALTIVLFCFSASACPAGQKALSSPPTNLAPLPGNWKEMVFYERTNGGKVANREKSTRLLFLDPPVPCTVNIGKKGFLAFGREEKQGYGGLFLEKKISGVFLGRPVGVEKEATLYFYIIDQASGSVSFYTLEHIQNAVVTPPIFVIERKRVRGGEEIAIKGAILNPVTRIAAAEFRALKDLKTFQSLPLYQ